MDECLTKPCHELAYCNNTFGSYHCHCPVGFIGNGKQCIGNVLHLPGYFIRILQSIFLPETIERQSKILCKVKLFTQNLSEHFIQLILCVPSSSSLNKPKFAKFVIKSFLSGIFYKCELKIPFRKLKPFFRSEGVLET